MWSKLICKSYWIIKTYVNGFPIIFVTLSENYIGNLSILHPFVLNPYTLPFVGWFNYATHFLELAEKVLDNTLRQYVGRDDIFEHEYTANFNVSEEPLDVHQSIVTVEILLKGRSSGPRREPWSSWLPRLHFNYKYIIV